MNQILTGTEHCNVMVKILDAPRLWRPRIMVLQSLRIQLYGSLTFFGTLMTIAGIAAGAINYLA